MNLFKPKNYPKGKPALHACRLTSVLFVMLLIAAPTRSNWGGVMETRLEGAESVSAPLSQSIPLFVYGIVNPFGPTLMGFSLAPPISDKEGVEAVLIYFSLNPFSQHVDVVSEVFSSRTSRETEVDNEFIADLSEYFERSRSEGSNFGCPTFVIFRSDFQDKSPAEILEELEITEEIVGNSSNAVDTLKNFESYPSDVWSRVNSEIDQFFDKANNETDLSQDNLNGGKDVLSESQKKQLVKLIRSRSHIAEELGGFFYAWDGAILNANSEVLKSTALTKNQMLAFLPILPDVFHRYIQSRE